MGQFYKGADITFLDNAMYNAPAEMMSQALAKKDKEVEDTAKAKDELSALLNAKGLKVDDPRLQEIIGGYTNQVGEISSGIYGDAMNAAMYMPKIEDLKRKINTDWKMGEVSKIQGNLAAYDADLADWKAKQKTHPELYTDEYIDTLSKQSLAKYKGINYKNVNDYQTYTGEAATAMPDMNKWVDERLKDAIPDMQSITREKDTGKWLVKTKNETKAMSERDLNDILQRSFQGDVNLQSALKQRGQFGMQEFQDLTNEKGEFNPTIAFQATKKGGEVPIYANNMLGNAFKAGLTKFGFTNVIDEQTLDANPYALKDYDFALAKKKEKEDTEFVSAVDHNTMNSYTGTNSVEYNTLNTNAAKTIATIGEKAMTIALKQYSTIDRPIKTPEDLKRWMPTVYKQIQSGEFSTIKTPAMKDLQTQYNNVKFEQDIRDNTLASWKKQQKGPINWKDPKTVQNWNNWVKDHGTVVADAKVGWGYLTKDDGTQLNAKQVDHVISQAGELVGDSTFNLPKGTYVTVKGKRYDLANYHSANAIINAGLGTVEQVKAGQEQTMINGKAIPGAFTVKLADGKQTINFSMNAKSIQPVFGASDSGKVELQGNFTLNGKTYTSRLPELSSETLDAYNNRNAKTMKGQKMITKVGKSSVTLPNSGGVIYHGDAGDKDLIKGASNYDPNLEYSAGWLEVPNGKGGYEIRRMEDPTIKNQVYNMLGG
jgi:hypothetical protein